MGGVAGVEVARVGGGEEGAGEGDAECFVGFHGYGGVVAVFSTCRGYRRGHSSGGTYEMRTLETSTARDGTDWFSAGRWVRLEC